MNVDLEYVDYTGYDSPVCSDASDGDEDQEELLGAGEVGEKEAEEDQVAGKKRLQNLGDIDGEWVSSQRDKEKACLFFRSTLEK